MRSTIVMLALAVIGGLAESCAPSPGGGGQAAGPGTGRDSSLEGRLLAEVNRFRAANGREPVGRHRGLDHLALRHSRFMMEHRGEFGLHGENVSHWGFEERAMAARRVYQMDALGEIVISGHRLTGDIPQAMVRGWSRSASHRHTMLGTWQWTGVGVVCDEDGAVWATQLFGTPQIAGSPWSGPQHW